PRRISALSCALLLASPVGCGGGGGGDGGPPSSPLAPVSWVKHWNQVAVDASGIDHTPVQPGESRVYGEQLGPGRASRAIAIVQGAVFEAVNAITGGYLSYTGLPQDTAGSDMKAAIAQAAHDPLVAVFPSQAPSFDAELETALAGIPDGPAKE